MRSRSPVPSAPLAAIDMGSNSFRVEIGQVLHGRYRRSLYRKETVRLGAGLDAENRLTAGQLAALPATIGMEAAGVVEAACLPQPVATSARSRHSAAAGIRRRGASFCRRVRGRPGAGRSTPVPGLCAEA